MLVGTTESGYKFEVDKRVRTDWRFVQAYTKLKEDSASDEARVEAMRTVLNVMFKDSGKSLMKHIAEKNDGYCDMVAMMVTVHEILTCDEELKK